MTAAVNSFATTRRYCGHVVQVKAHWIERIQLWSLSITRNGEAWDVRQSDDVLADATDAISEAFAELVEGRTPDDDWNDMIDRLQRPSDSSIN